MAAGGCYLTPDIAMKLAAGRRDPLTKRERQVAEKLAQGMAVKRDCRRARPVAENRSRSPRQPAGKTGRQQRR
ncbi:hypothetical protein LNP25_07725 [Klebsiella variicola subsp. variicola]|nr:hypothetical protein [Klebsiella variicola subsp. variicola]